jgi:hypothetical protein
MLWNVDAFGSQRLVAFGGLKLQSACGMQLLEIWSIVCSPEDAKTTAGGVLSTDMISSRSENQGMSALSI